MSESEVVRSDRLEERSLRDVEDGGWWKRVNGRRVDLDDIPSGDEL